MINVAFSTLGCPKNLVDTEKMIDHLRAAGFAVVDDVEHADVLVLNTCGFINKAQEESVQVIVEYLEYKKQANILFGVVGCLVQRFRESLSEQLPDVDFWLGVQDSHLLPETIGAFFPDQHFFKTPAHISYAQTKLTPPHYAYIKVADGCDHSCAFCVIPSIRGPYQSVPLDTITSDVTHAARNGVKEICLVAQDISCYGSDLAPRLTLTDLLNALEAIDGIEWIRLLYLYPMNVTDALIDCIAHSKKICRYIDIPFQHFSTPILKKMHRPETAESIDRLITTIRDRIPGVGFRTSVITGFPGETKQDFKNLQSAIKKYKFERLGVFTYSDEQGTTAATLPDKVPAGLAEKRYHTLMQSQMQIAGEVHANLIGTVQPIIIDALNEDGAVIGRSQWDAPEIDGMVLVNYPKNMILKPGDIVPVKIENASNYDLEGIVIDEFTE